MCQDLDYGFDWSRERIEISEKDPLWDDQPIKLQVRADRGWQSTGVRFAPHTRLKLQPSGSITLAPQPKPWLSEPAGVTIEYHRGRPLGQLLACVLPNATPAGEKLVPLQIIPIDKETAITIDKHSWLLLRVNDAVGQLADNTGAYKLVIQ